MLTRDDTALRATRMFIHVWNEPSCLYSPAAEHHRPVAGTRFPSRVGQKAELVWVAVAYRGGLPVRPKRSPIPVLTGPDVE